MNKEELVEAKLEYIAWHDAELEQLVINLDGQIDLALDTRTYYRPKQGNPEVWFAKVVIGFSGVSKLTMDGSLAAQDWFGDAELLDSNRADVPILALKTPQEIQSAWFLFQESAARINIDATSAVLKVFEPVEYIQDYRE